MLIILLETAVVLQIITYNKAYSLYPYATFENQMLLWMAENRGSNQGGNAAVIVKYTNCGFNFIPTTLPRNSDIFGVNLHQTVRDSMTWTIDLDMDSVVLRGPMTPTSPPFTFKPITIYSWTLATWSTGPYMRYTIFCNFCLHYAYITACLQELWVLQRYFNQQGKLERYKLYFHDLSDSTQKANQLITWSVTLTP